VLSYVSSPTTSAHPAILPSPPPLSPPPFSPHPSAADLALSSVHKEVAKALVASLEDPSSTDASPFAAVAAKSCALVDRLSAWFPGGIPPGAGAAVVSDFQALMKREGIPAGVERFLWGVANAEPRLRGKGSA
jgi:hypothetical protein